MRTFLALPLVLLAATLSVPAAGQTASPNAAPDPVFEARLARAQQFLVMPTLLRDSLVTPRWVDADRLVYWDETGPHAGSWVLVNARAGTREPVVAPELLRRRLAARTGEPVETLSQLGFSLAPDRRGLLFAYRHRAFRLDLDGGRLSDASAFEARILDGGVPDADGSRIAAARDGRVVVHGADGRLLFARDGEPDYGWSLPEQPWSPDGSMLVVARTDERALHRIPIVTYDAAIEQVAMVPYAKAGTALARQEFHLFAPADGRLVRVAPSEGDGYDWFAGWRADGETALFLHLSRNGKRLDLSAVDAAGTRRLLLREERLETNVGDLDFITDEWRDQVTPLADGGFLWMSERDGWRHVYRYDAAGGLVAPITRGGFPVRRVDAVLSDGTVVVTASIDPDRPYEARPYRTSLAGGALRPIGEAPGLHREIASPSGQFLLDLWSSPTQPRIREIVPTGGGTRLRLTASDDSAVRAIGWRPPEPIETLAADGETRLFGAIWTPNDFDPARRYPVIAYIYGGPFTTVLGGGYATAMSLWANSLAQMGFVVVAIDVRGSASRSKAFQDATYGKVGQSEIADYVAGLRQAAATRPWMDLERAGIYGHSWGGYFALRGMLTAPEFFKAGYAGAPGALEEDAAVNEPNMGLPQDNPDGYAAGSNMALAANLRGQLKIMHGTADTNASLSTTMRMARALIDAGKQFDLLLIPGMGHNSQGPDGLYYHADVARFFVRTLGEPR